MATTQASGFDRFNEALRNLDDQLQTLRDRFDDRRKQLERQFRRRADRLQDDIRTSTAFKRAERARKDVGDAVEKARDQVMEVFGLATKSDIERLSRKLNTLSKKVNELSKEQESI